MYQQSFNKRTVLRFNRFSHKGYALFSCLGKEVLVGVLSVATLTYAKADGISIRTALTEDSLSREEVRLDEVVVTGSRAPLTQLQAAMLVNVITHEDIQRAAVTTINDVLKLATGVDVRQRGGFGVQTDISINGGTFDQMTILLNGVNLSSPQTGHNAADFPVSLNDIERIEVLEGAAARVFGSSAFSGAVNIVTFKDQTAEQQEPSRLKATVEGGSFGTWGGDLWLAVPPTRSATVAHQLSGGYTRSDGGTENSDFRKRRLFYQGQLSQPWMQLRWQAGLTSQDFGANTFYSAKYNNQYEETRRYIGSVSADVLPGVKGLHLGTTLYGHRDLDHYQLLRGEEGAAKGENYHRTDVYGITLDSHWDWAGGKTALGTDIRQEHILSTAYGDLLEESRQKAIRGSDRRYTREGRRTNTSFFLEHDVLLGGFTLSAGLLANRNTGLDNKYRLYPGIDLSFRPNSHWKLYASWNKALRMPTYTDLYTSNVVQQGDLDLKPEKNSAFKLGARYREHGWEVVASGFLANGTDMIDWVYETEESTRYHAMNIGKLKNMGVSVDATLDMGARWGQQSRVLDWLRPRLQVGYAYIHQQHETALPIYRSLYALEYLRHKVTARLDHRVWKKLAATWDVRWQQRMNGYEPYTKIDVKVQWEDTHYTVYLKTDNLTNHRYYDLGSVKQPGRWIMAGATFKL